MKTLKYVLIPLFLLALCPLRAQQFQRAVFHHKKEASVSRKLKVNQKLTVAVYNADHKLNRYRGSLIEVNPDSLFLNIRKEHTGFALTEIAWIRPTLRPIGWLIFSIGGLALAIGLMLLWFAALTYLLDEENKELTKSGLATGTVGVLVLVVGLILAIGAPTVKNPGEDWSVEIVKEYVP